MPVSILPRELKFTYGGFVVGGSSSPGSTRKLYGGWSINESFANAEVVFSFVITQDTEANFAAEVALVEAAFRKPRQDLTVTLGSTALNSYSHSSGTGYDAEPTILNQIDDPFGSGRSRKYDVRIVLKRPATNLSTNGRRDTSVVVEYDASNIKTLTLSGTYQGGSSAKTNFDSNFAGYATTVKSGLGGTWQEIERTTTMPDTGTADATPEYHTLTFTVRYRELIFSQVGANLDDSAVRVQKLTLTRTDPAPGDSPAEAVTRSAMCNAQIMLNVDKTVTTDLQAKWTASLPWVVSQIQTKLGVAAISVSPTVSYNHDDNVIVASLAVEGIVGAGLMEYAREEMYEVTTGRFLTPVSDGSPFSKYIELGPATAKFTVKETAVEFGVKSFFDLDPLGLSAEEPAPLNIPGFPGGDLKFSLLGRPATSRRVERRGRLPYQFDVTVWQRTTTWEMYSEYAGA